MFTRIDQRVAFLIDTQNMYHSAKNIHGARLAFAKVVDLVADHRPIIRAIAYVAKSKNGDEQAFFDALVSSGIELKVKDVQEFYSGAKKADWDVGMAVDAVKLAEKVDVLVLLTGDGDFVPLVEFLHGRGVIVEVAAFAESTNAQLRAVADRFYDISSEGRECLIGAHHMYRQPLSSKMNPVQAKEERLLPLLEETIESTSTPVSSSPKKGRGRPRKSSEHETSHTFHKNDMFLEDNDKTDDRPIRVTF
ncbi:NYN domain-containing protein [Candidatus Uhrbacteria bacterium]|nr:NYN domain-containing protein [Candidatus Uhrbacteria bacterium]